MSEPKSGKDDSSSNSYRAEQGRKPAANDDAASKLPPSVGAMARGAVGSEGADNESTGSPGADDERLAAEQRTDDASKS